MPRWTEVHAFLRSASRNMLADGRAKRQRTRQADYDQQLATKNLKVDGERKARDAAKTLVLHNCERILDVAEWEDAPRVKAIGKEQIEKQLAWHRAIEKKLDGKSEVPAYSKLNKEGKVKVLVDAVKRWNARQTHGSLLDGVEDIMASNTCSPLPRPSPARI